MLIGNNSGQPYGNPNMLSRMQTQKFPQQAPNQFMIQQSQPTSQCGICGKSFNLDLNLPKRLTCGHSFCLFCLTAQETQTSPSITIECPYCQIKYQHVPAAHFETNFEIVQVLEKVQQTLQQQQFQLAQAVPQQYSYPGQYPMQNQGFYNYQSPLKTYKGFNSTPPRFVPQAPNLNPQYDIRQVSQIFENMKLEVMNKSPQQLGKSYANQNASPISQRHSPLSDNFRNIQICSKEDCRNPRAVNGNYVANYCSKKCELTDQSKGALSKNQDAIYREAFRQKSRSKSPIKLNNFERDDYSPLRGRVQNQQRSRSPYSRSAINELKNKHSIFSSESESEGNYISQTPQVNRSNTINANNDQAMRRLNFDKGISRQSVQNYTPIQNPIQSTVGVFAESAFDKFLLSQQKDNQSQYFNPQQPNTNAFTQYNNVQQQNQQMSFQRSQTAGANFYGQQQQFSRQQMDPSISQDTRIDLSLAPNDPMRCVNPNCRNRKFLLNDVYLPVCSRACSKLMNIAAFPH